MVDDFIGTGDTAEAALNDLIHKGINKDKIVVISLVAQEQGLNKIRSLDIKTDTAYLRKKVLVITIHLRYQGNIYHL